jgi:hypothetical protein
MYQLPSQVDDPLRYHFRSRQYAAYDAQKIAAAVRIPEFRYAAWDKFFAEPLTTSYEKLRSLLGVNTQKAIHNGERVRISRAGVAIVYVRTYTITLTNLRSTISEIRTHKPDVLYNPGRLQAWCNIRDSASEDRPTSYPLHWTNTIVRWVIQSIHPATL